MYQQKNREGREQVGERPNIPVRHVFVIYEDGGVAKALSEIYRPNKAMVTWDARWTRGEKAIVIEVVASDYGCLYQLLVAPTDCTMEAILALEALLQEFGLSLADDRDYQILRLLQNINKERGDSSEREQ